MLGSIFIYSFARISAGVFFLGSVYIYVHTLGAGDYGVFAVAIAAAQVAALLSFGWLWYSSTRFMSGVNADTADDRLKVLTSTLGACALATTAFMGVCVLVGAIDGRWTILLPATLYALGLGLNEFLLGLFNARRDLKSYVVVSMTRYALSFCLGVLLVPVLRHGESGALWAMAIGVWGSLLLPRSVIVWAPSMRNFVPHVSREFWIYFYSGWSSALIFGMFSLTVLTNRFILNALRGSEEVGLLSGVTDLVNGPAVILFQVINLVFSPQVYGAANVGDQDRLRSTASEFLSLQLVLGLSLAVALLLLGPELSDLLIGASLGQDSQDIFGVAGVFSVLVVIFSMGALLLIATNRVKIALGVSLCTIAVNAVAVLFARGDVLATVVASSMVLFVGCSILIGISIRTIGYRLSSAQVALILSCPAASGLAIYLHHRWLPIGGALGSLIVGGVVGAMVCVAFDVLGVRSLVFGRVARLLARAES